MVKAEKAGKATTTIRVYEDTHYRLRVWAAKQKPRVSIQQAVAMAVDEFLANRKRGT